MKRKPKRFTARLVTILGCSLCVTSAMSQSIGSVTLSGNIRQRVEAWGWFGESGQNTYGFSDTLAQFAFGQTSSRFDWKIDMAVPILLDLPRHAIAPAPQGKLGLGGSYFASNGRRSNVLMIFPKQAYIRLKHEKSSLQVGRFEFADGAEATPGDPALASIKRSRIEQRLIGVAGFTVARRSFDGVNAIYSDGPWTVAALAAIPTRGGLQVDGWGWVKTPVAYFAATRQLRYSSRSSAEWRLFGVYYDDSRGVLKADNRPVATRAADRRDIEMGTYGGDYIQAIRSPAGTVDLLAWGALQTGKWGTLAQRSGAVALEAGIQPEFWRAARPWIRGGYDYASGDGNPNDGVHGTFFALLSATRQYARFPFFKPMDNCDAFGELILRPSKSLTIRAEVHHLALASANDLWYGGAGAFQPWTFGYSGRPSNGKTNLAYLYDSSVDYAFSGNASVDFYYGYAKGGDVIQAIYKNPNGQFGFVQLNYRF